MIGSTRCAACLAFANLMALVERLRDFDAVVLFRERTAVTAELLDQLPNQN